MAHETPARFDLMPTDASFAAEILLRLADLFDGGENPSTAANRLSEVQMQLLSKPATLYSQEPADTALRLRQVSHQIESQRPPGAPAIRH